MKRTNIDTSKIVSLSKNLYINIDTKGGQVQRNRNLYICEPWWFLDGRGWYHWKGISGWLLYCIKYYKNRWLDVQASPLIKPQWSLRRFFWDPLINVVRRRYRKIFSKIPLCFVKNESKIPKSKRRPGYRKQNATEKHRICKIKVRLGRMEIENGENFIFYFSHFKEYRAWGGNLWYRKGNVIQLASRKQLKMSIWFPRAPAMSLYVGKTAALHSDLDLIYYHQSSAILSLLLHNKSGRRGAAS